MKRFLTYLLILVIVGIGCNQDSSSKKSKSQSTTKSVAYVNDEYNFQVNFVNKPKVQASKINTSLGQASVVYFADEQNNITNIVSVTIYPEQFANQVDASASVKTQVVETAKGMKLTEVKSEENNIQGRPSYYLEAQGDNSYAIMQAIAIGNKVYIVASIAEGDNAKQLAMSDGVKFVKSFKLF